MLSTLFDHNPDLKRLLDEGFNVSLSSSDNHLLLRDVPYVASDKTVRYGTLVAPLTLNGHKLNPPADHVVHFVGRQPCDKDGVEIAQIKNAENLRDLDKGLRIDRTFSARPPEPFKDYYEKLTSYVRILEAPAKAVDPGATAKTFAPYQPGENESVFKYTDTASSRAGISAISAKLSAEKIGIVGLGGTGSYVLDLVAKTPVAEIHIFDGDVFASHNAFRSPGAPTIEQLHDRPSKVRHFGEIYANIRRGISVHEGFIDPDGPQNLNALTFVFLCMDGGSAKKAIIQDLIGQHIPFVDVGIGLGEVNSTLQGLLTTTTATTAKNDHIARRISFAEPTGDDEYNHNIQVAELNALNAALAVIKWKKLRGFYADSSQEHFTVYTIEHNTLINEECHAAQVSSV